MHSYKPKINFFNKASDLNKLLFLSGIFIVLTCLSSYAFASDDNFSYRFCTVVMLLKGPIGKTLCTIAILVIAVSFLMGKVQTTTLITVIVGVTIIYTAPNIVDLISGNSGSGTCVNAT